MSPRDGGWRSRSRRSRCAGATAASAMWRWCTRTSPPTCSPRPSGPRSPRRFEMILDRMPIGCILYDAEFRFVYWNKATERIFGYRFEEVRGRQPFGLITPASAQPLVEGFFRELAAGRREVDATAENMTRDGRKNSLRVARHAAPRCREPLLRHSRDVSGRDRAPRDGGAAAPGRRRWRRSASSPAASPTISTICSRSSSAISISAVDAGPPELRPLDRRGAAGGRARRRTDPAAAGLLAPADADRRKRSISIGWPPTWRTCCGARSASMSRSR